MVTYPWTPLRRGLMAALLLFALSSGCSDDDNPGNNNNDNGVPPAVEVMPSSELPGLPGRDWVVLRGIIHEHSPYSHDACDGNPRPDGERNEACFQDVRHGMCATRQDFVFLTDHDDLYAYFEYPEVLLYAEGDTLIERNGDPVANRVSCGDGHEVIVAAGTESAMMPIGLEHHVGDTLEQRMEAYNTVDATTIHRLQDAGGLVFLQHTEEWSDEEVLGLPIDGIEMYNTHFNLEDNMQKVLELVLMLVNEPENLPAGDVALLPVFEENEADLAHWARAVLQRRMVAILATDAHQNVIDEIMPDGDRLDSFRRLMRWFSNYVLVPPGPVDDAVLKDAIAEGRLYGAFDYLGYPLGFDFHAEADATIYEMGEEVPAGGTVTLTVTRPTVWHLDPDGPQPVITCRLLRAETGGVWQEVDSAEGDLHYTASPGVYRAEVRILPNHLRPWLGQDPDRFLAERVWIYANPIYVR